MSRVTSVEILRTDGSSETHQLTLSGRSLMNWCHREIGAKFVDTVNLRDGRVMIVDDAGHAKTLTVNPEATKLYHSVCRLGTTHEIVGDVAIVLDDDFADYDGEC